MEILIYNFNINRCFYLLDLSMNEIIKGIPAAIERWNMVVLIVKYESLIIELSCEKYRYYKMTDGIEDYSTDLGDHGLPPHNISNFELGSCTDAFNPSYPFHNGFRYTSEDYGRQLDTWKLYFIEPKMFYSIENELLSFYEFVSDKKRMYSHNDTDLIIGYIQS